MTNKQDINNLIIKFRETEQQLQNLRSELTKIVSKLPDKDVDESTSLIVALKYDIKYNDLESWERIKDLP